LRVFRVPHSPCGNSASLHTPALLDFSSHEKHDVIPA
jgi:hypothetical protein